MRPKEPTGGDDLDLFRARLENIVDQRHALVRLAALIDWKRFDEAFGALYSDGIGRPGLPTRLMVGLGGAKVPYLAKDEIQPPWRPGSSLAKALTTADAPAAAGRGTPSSGSAAPMALNLSTPRRPARRPAYTGGSAAT